MPRTLDICTALHTDPKVKFDFEDYLVKELSIVLEKPPFKEVCQYFIRGTCKLGDSCPYQHPAKARAVVCKHWLRGLCKKGDICEFLHEFNMKRMPECWFYAKLGDCTNPECQYLHIDPESKIRECSWYARGFCKHGPTCRHKHVRKAVCQNYLTGFCPKGESCQFGHPKFEIPAIPVDEPPLPGTAGAPRHLGSVKLAPPSSRSSRQDKQQAKPLTAVTCFKCGGVGHYANVCPKRRRMDDD